MSAAAAPQRRSPLAWGLTGFPDLDSAKVGRVRPLTVLRENSNHASSSQHREHTYLCHGSRLSLAHSPTCKMQRLVGVACVLRRT